MRPGRRRRLLVAASLLVGALLAAGLGWRPVGAAWKRHAGERALAAGDADRALACFVAAESFDAHDAQTQFLLARIHRRMGHSEETYERLQKARDCGLSPERLQREWILAKAQAGLLSQVEPALAGLLTSAGEDGPEICSAFTAGYVRNYQFDKALQLLTAWVADYPRDPEPHLALGRIALKWENLHEAETHFRAALRLCPEYRGGAGLLAQALVEQKKYDAALAVLEESGRTREADDEARLLRAQCLLNLGRQAEALTLFAAIAARSPENCEALLGLGQGELWARRAEAALEHLDCALKVCPGNLDIRYARAQALSLRGEREESQRELRDVAAARAALIDAGVRARKLLQNPESVDDRFEVGATQMKYGDRSEGVAWLLTVLEYEPDHQPTHRLLAQYYDELGDERQAARHRRALTAR